jgi:uncharacterized protein
MKKWLLALCILLSLSCIGSAGAEELVLAVGPAGGDMARLGVSLASILSDAAMTVKAVESAGDPESIARIASGSADLAVVDSLSAYEAALGIGEFPSGKRGSAPAAAVVGFSVEHFVLIGSTKDQKDITALSGKILYLGPNNDPETNAARTIISALEIDSFFEVGTDWDYETAAELMIDGTFDGAVFSGVVPLKPVSRLTSAMGSHLVLLTIPDEKLITLRNRWPVWFPYVVPGGTYPGIDEPYETVARPILLLAAQGLDKARVKEVLSRLFERAGGPAATGLPAPLTESMTQAYCPIKLHPGAAEYFKERGR